MVTVDMSEMSKFLHLTRQLGLNLDLLNPYKLQQSKLPMAISSGFTSQTFTKSWRGPVDVVTKRFEDAPTIYLRSWTAM